MDDSGDNLIFIISQPRSGSTLLQHILGSHSQVYTLPEPWFMLHMVYGLRSSGLEAEYNARLAHAALRGLLEAMPSGQATYLEAVRRAALYLYGKALQSSGKVYFLDKTPRYYLIITELGAIFPKAKFVFLLRNPLAVLSSILEVSLGGEWKGLARTDRRHDLLSAPRLMLEGIPQLGGRATVVHYEQLVTQPVQTVRDLCHQIGLLFEPDMLSYGGKLSFDGTRFVDSKSIYEHQRPVTDYLDQWLTLLDTPQKIHLARGYLAALGQNVVDSLGYCYEDLLSDVESLKSNGRQLVVPWELLMTPLRELPWWNRLELALVTSLQHRGISGTLRRCASLVVRGR